VLEKAEKENDYQFLSGVQKAFKFTEEKLAFKVTAKDLVRIAIYSLLAFGYKGTKSQLRELLDPDSSTPLKEPLLIFLLRLLCDSSSKTTSHRTISPGRPMALCCGLQDTYSKEAWP
jgi:hypothetical protein